LTQSDIMIVDDKPANLKLLEDMLLQQGLEVRSFPLGRLALAAAAKNPPDLILLDINMPEMNGYEVCQRLKSAAQLAEIPVIFLSALSDTQDKVKAFHSGAVDYISKPFQIEEVQARVKTHLKLHQLQRELKRHNERLEEAVAARTRELGKANQRLTILDRSKNEFLNLISHEFRTPLHGLLGAGEMMLSTMSPSPENDKLQGLFERSRRRILSILDDAMLLTEIDVHGDQFASTPVALHAALSRAMERAHKFAELRGVALRPPSEDGRGLVLADQVLLEKALQALLETAVKFSKQGGSVRLSHHAASDALRVMIETDAGTIPASVMPKFFDLFSMGETLTAGGDLGLSPAVANRVLSLFGGAVSVANREPSGIRFTISLKEASPNPGDSASQGVEREWDWPAPVEVVNA
jgi:two-component system sensor histidine kinase/response regulator